MRGLYNAAGAMLVNQVRLENISNNIANLNTPGFKRSEVVVRTFPEILLFRLENVSPSRAAPYGPIGIAAENIAVEEMPLIQLPGTLWSTGRRLDLALKGEGFFVLDTPQGLRYTRDGHFLLSDQGYLVNRRGFPVLGEGGPLFLGEGVPVIDSQGRVFLEGEPVDRLLLVAFDREAPLWKDGHNLFQAGEGAVAQPAAEAVVFQGYLEESNADLARQVTDLVRVRRSYEAAQRIAQTYDQILSRAANELASLG